MTEEEIKSMINQYLTSKRLFKPHYPEFVNVAQDRLLLDTILTGKENREELLEKKFMHTNEVINRIVNTTKACYKISTGDGQSIIRSVLRFRLRHSSYSQPPSEGKPVPILVNIASRSNHTITYISGFEIFRLDADSLAERLKTACASSTKVQPDPRKPELKQVMVQGEHAEVIAECLIARGIPREWIKVVGRIKIKGNQTGKHKPM